MTGRRLPKRPMLPDEALDAAAREMGKLARKQGVRAALAGGYAARLYGFERLTADVDFVADAPVSGVKRKGKVTFGGFKTVSPGGVPVDWIVRSDDYQELYQEALENSPMDRKRGYRVVPLSYLAAMKMVAGRPKDEADLMDILMSRKLNVRKTRQIIRRTLGAYAADDFDSRVAEARWRKESER